MLRRLRWLFFLLLPYLGWAQTAPSFQFESVLGTPLFSPSDVAVDSQGFIYVLEDDPISSPKRGFVNKLDPQGHFVTRFDINKPGYVPGYTCDGSALVLDAAGNMYISDHNAGEVRKFSPTGQLLRTIRDSRWQPCSLYNPKDLAVDAAGSIVVGDDIRVQKLDAQGTPRWEYAPPVTLQPGVPEVHLWAVDTDTAGNVYFLNSKSEITKLSPAGQVLQTIQIDKLGLSKNTLALDAAGNFYVGVSGGSPVYKFGPTGKLLQTIGPITSSGDLALALDRAGKLYACSSGNFGWGATLYKFEPTGTEITRWGGWAQGFFLAQNSAGEYYVYDFTSQQLIKHAANGQELLRFGGVGYGEGKFEQNNGSGDRVAGVAVDAHGNVYTAENTLYNGQQLQKFDGQGRFLNIIRNADLNQGMARLSGITVDPADNIYLADSNTNQVLKLDQQGKLLLRLGPGGVGRGQFTPHQALATDELGFLYVADSSGLRIHKFAPTGQLVRQTRLRQPAIGYFYTSDPASITVDRTGNLFVSLASWDSTRVIDRSGRVLRSLPSYLGSVRALSINREGTRLLSLSLMPAVVTAYTNGTAPRRQQSRIQGRIFQDLNADCVAQPTEPALAGIMVVAEPGEYYGVSDERGNYTIATDTGTYTVRQLLPQEVGRTVQQTCAAGPALVRVASYDATLAGPDFGNQVSTTPYLRVQIAANRRRRCFQNVTTVSYSNVGYGPAANAVVTVALPPQVAFISANAPHTRDASGNYQFAVGTLQPYQQGTILIQDSVVCGDPDIRGLTVCTKAWISPANNYPVPPTGAEANVTVQGRAQAGNQVRFVVRNAAARGMADSLSLRMYQNSTLALQHRYRLAAGDSLVLRVPATRPVVRLEADQPTGHPTQRLASATVEVRALSAPGQANPDMVALPPNAPSPEVAEDCQPIRDSYDPNDKLVTPAGATAQHYTPTGVPLSYRVRFQNTGNDDAYRVQVVDTLAADFDLRTLRVAAASHPYQLQVSGHGRPVLTFTFSNINLPPSTRDAVGSNGFVEFSVQPKAGLPAKALLENAADIFFDFNPPVRTNFTSNRLYDQPLVVEPAVALAYADVLASPALLQVAPAQGRAGTLVTLSGQRFGATAAANVVRFNGVPTPVLSANATTLTVRVPTGATTGSVQVITGEGAGRSAQSFTIYQPPVLTALTPAEGVPGSLITLTGREFAAAPAQDTVWFGGVPAVVQQASATTLRVVVPAGAPTGPVRVATLGGQVESTQPFVVWYPPTLSGFSPGRGRVGDILTLAGSNFALVGRNTVVLGGGTADVLAATATSLRVRVPVTAQSGPIRVQTPGGVVLSAAPFTFLPPPTVTTFAPAQASVGEVVTLTGKDFLVDGRADTVLVGGVRAPVLATSATSLTIRVPRGAQSGPLMVVGTGGRGQSVTAFTVLALPAAEAIAVYPNPAHNAVTLDWLRADFALEQVRVYNALGQLVTTLNLRQQAASNLSIPLIGQTGLFVLVIQTSQGPVLKRITLY
jgi:sugar lactone lactonase YvrE